MKRQTCAYCNGSGMIQYAINMIGIVKEVICSHCHGTGKEPIKAE